MDELNQPRPRRVRRRDLNALDESVDLSDGDDGSDGVPEVGMTFKDHQEVNKFYRRYARRLGFGVSVRRSSFTQEGVCLYLELMCCKGGQPRYEPKFRKRASSTTNCQAKLRVKMWGDGLLHVELVVLDHNHPVSPAMARFLNSYKQLSGAAKRRLRMGTGGALPVEEPSRMPIDKLGELEGLLFGESDHRSFVERGQLKFGEGDAEALRLFFTRMQARNPNFFNIIDLDESGCARNVFWADARSRAAYEYYNDVVALDTSYIVSRNDMPLATFTGVNNHGQQILLGCCLLSDETAETYAWLLKTWIACMSGNLPKAIVTEHCKGIQDAVMAVLPGVRHRMCLFQIMKKATERLGGLADYRSIHKAFQKAIYDSLTSDDFEENWSRLIQIYGLQGHEWLKSLYECRHSWAPVYLKDTLWVGMSVNQRNDTIAPFFENYVDPKTTLKQFLGKYEMALQSKYEKEAQADFETFHKRRPPVSKFFMEEQLAKLYTHNMFKKFQDEIEDIMYCHATLISIEGSMSSYTIKECIFLEDGKRTMNKQFSVTYNAEDQVVKCICGFFQFTGILCRHALSVFKLQQVHEIPLHYILDRWKKEYKRQHVLARTPSDAILNNRVDRYDYLSHRCLLLVDVGVLSDKHQLALKLIKEAEKFLLSENTHDGTQPRIKPRVPKANRLNKLNGQTLIQTITSEKENGADKDQVSSAMVVAQASQASQKIGPDGNPLPAGYIGLPTNMQQYVANQGGVRPSIVYMVPGNVNPQTFQNGVLMPWMYPQMYQANVPNVQITPSTSENPLANTAQPSATQPKKRRRVGPRSHKSSELSQEPNEAAAAASSSVHLLASG